MHLCSSHFVVIGERLQKKIEFIKTNGKVKDQIIETIEIQLPRKLNYHLYDRLSMVRAIESGSVMAW